MVLYAFCHVCTFSLRRASPDMILGDKPLLSQGGSITVGYQSKIWCQTYTKASKNNNNVVGEERLAHIRTIVVSLDGKLTYLFICLYKIASLKVWCDFWSVDVILLLMILFCCLWFVELLGLVDDFFVVYGIFGCFCLRLGHWVGMKIPMAHKGNEVKCPRWGWSRYESTIGHQGLVFIHHMQVH
jgi:hypothetical protein